jgi:23S rRNA pseudouridine2605 synthase
MSGWDRVAIYMEEQKVRLQVYLARSGVASRRASEELIKAGRVSVNGRIVQEMGIKVSPQDRIELDQRLLHWEEERIYLALHKPPGYLCSNADDKNRPLAGDFFIGKIPYRVFHVGRLDFLSSGLIFYTNDGEFARIVTHPAQEIEKTYLVETMQPVPISLLEQYKTGIWIEKQKYKCYTCFPINKYKVKIVLTEGKNREIRKVFKSWKIGIKRIHRIQIGIVELDDLKPGQFRLLRKSEIAWFYMKKSNI